MIKIIDNFYNEYAIKLLQNIAESCDSNTCGESIRSDDLKRVSPQLYEHLYLFLTKELSLQDNFYINTYISKHTYHPTNIGGRIHIDGRNPSVCDVKIGEYKLLYGGMIFISDVIDPESGISFYECNNDSWTQEEKFNNTLNVCYTYNKDELNDYHSNFYETLNVKNIKNRFVLWKAGLLHKMNDNSIQRNRVVQSFYISKI